MFARNYFVSFVLTALLIGTGAIQPALALDTSELIGRWGVASYFAEKDAAATRTSAASACGQPYNIGRGRSGHPIMYSAFSGKPMEVVVQGDEIVNADGGDALDTRRILAADGSSMTLRYVSEEAAQRYGTMIFIRCRK